MQQVSWSRSVPVRYQADVAVIGGGIAGVSAAAAAARSGASVVLVERFGVTGGNMTVGGVANFCGETAGQGEVFDEILRHLMGQAAGIGAALAVAGDTDIARVDPLDVRRGAEQRGAHLGVGDDLPPPPGR